MKQIFTCLAGLAVSGGLFLGPNFFGSTQTLVGIMVLFSSIIALYGKPARKPAFTIEFVRK